MTNHSTPQTPKRSSGFLLALGPQAGKTLCVSSTCPRPHALSVGHFTPTGLNPGVTVSKETLTLLVLVTPGHRNPACGE